MDTDSEMDRSLVLDIHHSSLSVLDFASEEAVPVVRNSAFCIRAVAVLFAFYVIVVDKIIIIHCMYSPKSRKLKHVYFQICHHLGCPFFSFATPAFTTDLTSLSFDFRASSSISSVEQ